MTVAEAKLANNIGWTPTITKWLRESKREKEELVCSNQLLMVNKVEDRQSDPDKKALEQALAKLQEAELKVKALNTLIDIAEEQFKITIRKKPGAKQS
jgi:transposase